MINRLLLTLLVMLTAASASWSDDQPAKGYTFGVLPYLSAARLEPIYVPVSIAMSEATGRKVKFRIAITDKKFFLKLKQQAYDIALIQPFWYPPSVDRYNYVPLVRFSEPLTTIIMVLDDSPIKSVNDLKGKTIATPPAITPIAHMVRLELEQRGLLPGTNVRLKATKAIDSCIQQVVIGEASACAGPHFARTMIAGKLNVKLRSILETPGIPNFSLVAHSRVPADDRSKIRDLLLSWGNSNDARHQKLLKSLNTSLFVPAIDAEYDIVRSFLRDINSTEQ